MDEALRGYYTKYDCSAADINPIGGDSALLHFFSAHHRCESEFKLRCGQMVARHMFLEVAVDFMTDELYTMIYMFSYIHVYRLCFDLIIIVYVYHINILLVSSISIVSKRRQDL